MTQSEVLESIKINLDFVGKNNSLNYYMRFKETESLQDLRETCTLLNRTKLDFIKKSGLSVVELSKIKKEIQIYLNNKFKIKFGKSHYYLPLFSLYQTPRSVIHLMEFIMDLNSLKLGFELHNDIFRREKKDLEFVLEFFSDRENLEQIYKVHNILLECIFNLKLEEALDFVRKEVINARKAEGDYINV